MKLFYIGIFLMIVSVSIGNAENLQYTFENPPYVIGSMVDGSGYGQDGWYLLGTVLSSIVDSSSAATNGVSVLNGSQSLFAQKNGTIRHSLQNQYFAENTAVSWKMQAKLRSGFPAFNYSDVVLNNKGGASYCIVKFTIGGNITAANDQLTGLTYTEGDIYYCKVVLNFANQNYHLYLQNLTTAASLYDAGVFLMTAAADRDTARGEVILRHTGKGVYDDLQFISPCSAAVTGDMNDDCKADFKDFALLAQNWLKSNLSQ